MSQCRSAICRPIYDGDIRCQLEAGHEGEHQARRYHWKEGHVYSSRGPSYDSSLDPKPGPPPKCRKHPRYKGVGMPRKYCSPCWYLWAAVGHFPNGKS